LNNQSVESGQGARRQYLPAQQRKKELLAAALMEFSVHGYGAATIERIAKRAGLSKAGVYSHYKSKEEMFEDLLLSRLTSSFLTKAWLFDGSYPLDEAIDAFIEQIYTPLDDPEVVAVLRILMSESDRASHLIQRWRREVVEPYLSEQQRLIDACIAKGLMPDNALTRYFYVSISPLMMALQKLLVFGDDDAKADVARIRETHRELLRLVLEVKP